MAAVDVPAAEPNDLSLWRNHLYAEHVIRGQAVLQAVHAAGVFRDVAPYRARDLTRRIRRVVETAVRDRVTDGEIRHAALRNHAAVRIVDIEDPIELAHRDDD